MSYGLLAFIVTMIITIMMTDRTTVVSSGQKNIPFEYSGVMRRFFRIAMIFNGICLCIAVYFGIQEKYQGAVIIGIMLGLLFIGSAYYYLVFNNRSAMIMKDNFYSSDWRGRESVHAMKDIDSVTFGPQKEIRLVFTDGYKYSVDRMMSNNQALLDYLSEKGIPVKDKKGKAL